MLKILIVDDHIIFREGLIKILEDKVSIKKLDQANDGREALGLVMKNDYDIILLDISLPGRNGVEVLEDIKRIKPHLPVLMLSAHPEEQFALRAFKAGAAGYLTKKTASDELINAINTILNGRKYVSLALAEKLVLELEEIHSPKLLHEKLSAREYQVMCMIASGKALGDIADELAVSVATVSTYRRRLLEKMGKKNNAEIVQYVITHGLME